MTDQAPDTTKQTEKESFSREYVHELREENKNWRTKAQGLESDMAKAKADAEKSIKEAQDAASQSSQQAHSTANERIIRAELKAYAIEAGMVDIDGLKLADLSSVKLSDSGEVEGAKEMIASLKEAKSYLFKTTSSSTHTGITPPPKTNEPFDARKASADDYEARKRKYTG